MQKAKTIIGRIICAILGAGLVFLAVLPLAWHSAYIFRGETAEINEVIAGDKLEEYEGEYVSVDIDAVLGTFAKTSRRILYAIPVGSDYHYIVWLDDESFIAASVDGAKAEAMEEMTEATWAFINGEAESLPTDKIRLEGTLEPLKGELLVLYNKTMDEAGFSEADRQIRPYVIDAENTRRAKILRSVVVLAIGALLLFAAFKKWKEPALEEEEADS